MLTHGFGPKTAIFRTFFFSQYKPGKCLLRYSRAKKRFPWLWKQEVLIVEIFFFFSKGLTHGLAQKWPFLQLFFLLSNKGQENVFYNKLERKNFFLGYENKKFKKSKYWHFSKRVNPRFWSKNVHFFNLFFFRQYRIGKCFLRYSKAKKPLSRLWKKEVQKVEILTFFQSG